MRTSESTHLSLVQEYFRATVDYWDDVYAEGTLNGALYRVRAEKVLDLVACAGRNPESARVLEIGCGAGRTSVALAGGGYLVDALDVVPEMLEHVRQRANAAGVSDRVALHTGDVNRLQFANGTFDIVLAIGVLEWSSSLEGPLAEMARVLKPGGHLVVNVDNALALHCLLDPRLSPLVGAAKRALRPALERLRVLRREARPGRCAPWRLDGALHQAGLSKVRGLTCGFGPFTLLGRRILSDRLGLRLHEALQKRADRELPAVRAGGETYLTLSVRT